MNNLYVHLSPRLQKAAEMLDGYHTVADIGCDHGRLSAALLQKNLCRTIIATDISSESLQKAKQLITHIGLADRASFRQGNGLAVIEDNECDAIAILGMGGTLMRQILENEFLPLKGAKAAVFQPMRAQAEIRRYLHDNCYHIIEDSIIREDNRLYQIFCAEKKDTMQSIPDEWPVSFFDIGYMSYVQKDPNLPSLIQLQMNLYQLKLTESKGTEGEARIMEKIKALQQIQDRLE